MITLEQLYAQVEGLYFGSNDFNGLPLYYIDGAALAEARQVIRRGVELEYFQVEVSNNPHIKFTALAEKSHQLAWLDSDQFSGSACLYPHPSKLKDSPKIAAYEDRPYSKSLALGAGQFDFKTFDVSVLEYYRNDPRYHYETDFIHGQIGITTEHYDSDAMHEHDKVLLDSFSFAYDDDEIRYVAVFLRYIHKLSPEHQKLWAMKEQAGAFKLNRDYFNSQVMGSWDTRISIFEAFVLELAAINEMCAIMGKPDFFHKTYVVDRPREFGFLLRPTVKEFHESVSLLDKMLSDNINKSFFKGDIPIEKDEVRSDGKVRVLDKGTMQLLEDWIGKYYKPNEKGQVNTLFSTLRKIRKLRQDPAHKINDNNFDNLLFKQQRQLVIDAYNALWVLRNIIGTHPKIVTSSFKLDVRLSSGAISDQ